MDNDQLNKEVLPKRFSQTSDGLYDRHDYKLLFKNGKSIIFDDYMEAQDYWMKTNPDILDHIDVLDKKNKKKTKKGGFK